MDRNVPFAKNEDKPCNDGILLHTIFNKDRIKKWNGKLDDNKNKFPYKVSSKATLRTINFYISTAMRFDFKHILSDNPFVLN